MPSAAPDKVRLFIARIIISASNKIIITLLTFSIPFCMPLLHTKNPAIAITAIHIIISGKNIKKGHEIQASMMQFDVAATVAAIFKLKQPQVWIGRPIMEVFK